MKWSRKKPPSSASSRPSLFSHVFPASWLTKFKQMSINPAQENAKTKQKGNRNSVSISPSRCTSGGGGGGGGRFYGGDGDAFWRLSFGDDSVDGKNRGDRHILRSVRYDADNEPEFLPSSCHNCRSRFTRLNSKEETLKFNNMVSEVRKMRGLPSEVEISPEIGEKVTEIRTPRLRIEKEKKLRKTNRRIFKEKQLNLHGESYKEEGIPRNVAAKNNFETESGKTSGIVERGDCKLTTSDSWKDYNISFPNARDEFSAENVSYEWKKLKEMKIEQLKSRNQKQRESLYTGREFQRKRARNSSKVRVYSPRTASKVEICRIKGLEDMKKAKQKMKKKANEKTMEGFTGLAVLKCSFDPQKDFRDSMIEMIMEKGIRQPEELEELLACYLTLNSDEYHDIIIKVFRQVWFHMNQACVDTDLEYEQNNQCYYD